MNISDIQYVNLEIMDRDDFLEEQGRRVREIIERENLSQANFSSITGIKTSTLNHVITGRNNISPTVMRQILSAFPKYNEQWIRTGMGDVCTTNANDVLQFSNPVVNNLRDESPITLFGSNYSIPEASKHMGNSFSRSLSQDKDTDGSKEGTVNNLKHAHRTINKIIVYYSDNTFETFILDK